MIETRGLVKHYGPVQALRGADFSAFPGEVVALMGDNGAGKSTLVKCLAGVVAPDAGEILVDGEPRALSSPDDARAHGIETVYQDLSLAPDLDAASNLFMGREILRKGLLRRLGVLDAAAMRQRTEESFGKLSIGLQDPRVEVASLSGGQRQCVAVGRAVTWASRVVIMDEPTAALGLVQTGRVRELIMATRDAGTCVILVSHDLPFVLDTADRVEILRLGERVARLPVAQADATTVLGAMTGVAVDGDRR